MIRELEKAKKLKQRLQRGEVCLGAQLALSDPSIVELFGRAGYDWLLIDTEHSATNLLSVKNMLQAGVHSGAVVLARPLAFDADEIRRLLDIGSPGLVCPFINTGEEAQQLVRACRYPPAGIRGYGPRRAGMFGLDADEYFETANDCLVIFAIIESRKGIDNIEDIVSVDGIDGITIGPMDLSIDLGIFKQFEHPDYVEAVDRVRAACHKYGTAMGTGCYSMEHAAQCIAHGDPLLIVAGDDIMLAQEAKKVLSVLREKADTA